MRRSQFCVSRTIICLKSTSEEGNQIFSVPPAIIYTADGLERGVKMNNNIKQGSGSKSNVSLFTTQTIWHNILLWSQKHISTFFLWALQNYNLCCTSWCNEVSLSLLWGNSPVLMIQILMHCTTLPPASPTPLAVFSESKLQEHSARSLLCVKKNSACQTSAAWTPLNFNEDYKAKMWHHSHQETGPGSIFVRRRFNLTQALWKRLGTKWKWINEKMVLSWSLRMLLWNAINTLFSLPQCVFLF